MTLKKVTGLLCGHGNTESKEKLNQTRYGAGSLSLTRNCILGNYLNYFILDSISLFRLFQVELDIFLFSIHIFCCTSSFILHKQSE